jgi:signal transduction histidine kinase
VPGRSTRFLLRLVFVLIGAALALAFATLDVTLIAILDTVLPRWSVWALGTAIVVVPVVALGLVAPMRTIEGVAVESLLAVDLPGGPPGPADSWPQRRRSLSWFALHLLAGAVVVAGVIGTIVAGGWWVLPALVTVLAGGLLLGELLARSAPRLLGPTDAERITILERDVQRAVERNRIAREIHDGVGHALSLITVQAGAARKVIDHDPQFAVDALAAIEAAAHDAAADLDHVLGLLREEGPADAAPAPDLTSIDHLVRATRTAGLNVVADVRGDVASVPGAVSREAYRIAQEALTNALKYSADGTAELKVDRTDGRLTVVARNPAPGSARGDGRGLRGITERVQALGGTVVADLDDGTWVLEADLPLPEAS